jgi:hypothetical protein
LPILRLVRIYNDFLHPFHILLGSWNILTESSEPIKQDGGKLITVKIFR